MMDIYKSGLQGLERLETIEEGSWINLISPTLEEIRHVSQMAGVDQSFISAATDEEERSRIEYDEDTNSYLIVIDIPFITETRNSRTYETLPIGIIYSDKAIITVCLQESNIIDSFIKGAVKTFFTYKKSRFILLLLYRTATSYLQYLKQIDKKSSLIETELHKSMKNQELIQLMDLEKSLVYFSTSLKSNEIVLEKLLRLDLIKKYPEDKELLEDTIIENKQAIEMAKIYSDILSGTMDAFASIISNNLNIVMKLLTSVTIVMAIPTMISSFYGMNVVNMPLAAHPYAFWLIMGVAAICCVAAALFMARKKLF
jgi:magnesium transporter